jgi:hypothetical protein
MLTYPAYSKLEPGELTVRTSSPRIDEGGYDNIKRWLHNRPDARLVVIDIFQAVRSAKHGTGKGGVYSEDYAAVAPFKKLAEDYSVTVLLVHHNRKARAEDPIEEISGSTGLTGAPDFVLALKRPRGERTGALYLTGRDVEDRLLSVDFGLGGGSLWTVARDALPPAPAVVLALAADSQKAWLFIRSRGQSPTADVAEHLGATIKATSWRLNEMKKTGVIRQAVRGAPGRPALWETTK